MSTADRTMLCTYCDEETPAGATCCAHCGALFTSESGLASEGEETTGNIINKGYVTEYEGFIYFSNSLDQDRLYRVRTDGTGLTKISNDQNSLFINVAKDYVYYSNPSDRHKIYRVSLKDNVRIALHEEAGIQYLSYSNGWLYYQSYHHRKNIYKLGLDGKECIKLNSDSSEHLNVVGGWLYYINTDDGNKIYRMRNDGSERTCLGRDKAFFLNVSDDWIYYSNADRGFRICKMRSDGKASGYVNDEASWYLNVRNDWIYYCSHNQDLQICKVKVVGSASEQFNVKNAMHINTVCGWLFYHSKADRLVRTIRLNSADHVDFQEFVSRQAAIGDREVVHRVEEMDVLLPDMVRVAAGHSHTLLLADNGEVYSCGSNEYGQLGHGDRKQRRTAHRIEGLAEVKDIAAGYHYSLVLLKNGDVYSFGCGADGRLGHGDCEDRLRPTKVERHIKAAAIAAGAEQAVVITTGGETVLLGESTDHSTFERTWDESDSAMAESDGRVEDYFEEEATEKKVLASEGTGPGAEGAESRKERKVNVGELVVTVPAHYIYSVDRHKTEGRLIVAIMPLKDDQETVTEDFRNAAQEYFFISKKAQVRDKIDIDKDCEQIMKAFDSLPGKKELVKKDDQVLIIFSDMVINHPGRYPFQYFGFIVTYYGAIYVLKTVFNRAGDLVALRDKTIGILQKIEVRVKADFQEAEAPVEIEKGSQPENDQPEADRIPEPSIAKRLTEADSLTEQGQGKIDYQGGYPVTITPAHLCAFYKARQDSTLAQECNHTFWEKGVALAMVALRLGIRVQPFELKYQAWELSRVFRVDDEVFNPGDDREVEIQRLFIKCASYLSALRSFAWTLKGYVDRVGQTIADVSIKEIMAISSFILERGFLNYTDHSYFPALCGVSDINAAYIPASPAEPKWDAVCKMSGCGSCGDLFALRDELCELYPVMADLAEYIRAHNADSGKPASGLLSDILYAWCSLSLAADKAFMMIEGPVSYQFPLSKGGAHNIVMPYAKAVSSTNQKLIEKIVSFNNANVEGTYFEIEVVAEVDTVQALRFEELENGEQVKLERRPEQPDNKTIQILNQKGEVVGYVPEENAVILAPALDQGLVQIISTPVLSSKLQPGDGEETKHPSIRIAVHVSYYS